MNEGPTKIVKFLLNKSLPDENPAFVNRERDFSKLLMVSDPIPEVLCPLSKTNEILWNFSRLKDEKRLTLKVNPHFYEKLPTSAEKYKGRFQIDPVETFEQEEISVLTDNLGQAGRVFLKTAKKIRAFGNVWVPKSAIIFKGSWLSFHPFSYLLTSSQTSVESLREKASSVRRSKKRPIYGVMRSLHCLMPLGHCYLIEVAHC